RQSRWPDDRQAALGAGAPDPRDHCAPGGRIAPEGWIGREIMKLRIKGSSLRLRLTQSEVRQLETAGEVAEQVNFGGGVRLTYRLLTDLEKRAITATYGNNVIEIRVPRESALNWSRTDQVALSQPEQVAVSHQEQVAVSQPEAAPAQDLRILIEKDWNCLAPRSDEDES